MQMKKSMQTSWKAWCPWICLLVTYLFSVGFFWVYGEKLLDSDMAADMLLANLLKAKGGFLSLSREWFYSTEIKTIDQPLFFKWLLYLFPDNFHLVRSITQAILLAVTAFSYIYMANAFSSKEKSVWFASILMCPFGFWYMYHCTFDGVYLIYMILIALSCGLVFRCALQTEKRGFRLGILAVLSFVAGIRGIRLLLSIYAPILLVGAILWAMRVKEKNGEVTRSEFGVENTFLISSVVAALGSGIGYLINSQVFAKIYEFKTYNMMKWIQIDVAKILKVFSGFFSLFGYPIPDSVFQPVVYLFTKRGILFLFSLAFILIVGFAMIRTLQRVQKTLPAQRMLILTMFISLAAIAVVPCITNKGFNASYFLPIMPLVIGLLQVEFDTEETCWSLTKPIASVAFGVVVVACSLATVAEFKEAPPRGRESLMDVVAFAENQDYEQGVSTFWGSNVVTELSNGGIEMWTVLDFEDRKVYGWLQKKEHAEHFPEGRGFVLIPQDEFAMEELILQYPGTNVVYRNDDFILVDFEDLKVLGVWR